MRVINALIITLMASLSLALGGEIYGTVKENGKPIKAGVRVLIVVNDTSCETTTDQKGAYSINMPQRGKGQITVCYEGQTPSHPIYSTTESARYDLTLLIQDGKYYLKRE
jgi:hypothetical protein